MQVDPGAASRHAARSRAPSPGQAASASTPDAPCRGPAPPLIAAAPELPGWCAHLCCPAPSAGPPCGCPAPPQTAPPAPAPAQAPARLSEEGWRGKEGPAGSAGGRPCTKGVEASPGRCECTALAPGPACVDAGGSGARGPGARHALPPASSPAGLGCTGAACRPGGSPGGTQAGHGHRTGAKAGGVQGRQGLLASRWCEHVSTRDGEPPGRRHAASFGPPAAVLARHAAAHRHRRALYAVHDG